MPPMEVINIRFFEQDIEQILSHHIVPVLKLDAVKKDWDVKVLQHYRLSMELVILLVSKHQNAKLIKSDLGLQLAENLKSLGIVNHVVWQELSV